MSSEPRVTVAIPVYNSAPTLERAIRSAMRQALREIEILVADDGSTDDSAAIADRLAVEDPRVIVHRITPNGGKPRAMNRMVAAARGAWVAVLDADDAFHDDRLMQLVTAAEAAGVEMVADNILYVDAGADQVVRSAFPVSDAPREVTKADLARHADTYADFDFGILKPIMRRDFLVTHGLTYTDKTRLSEDFYYLLTFFVAGGRGLVLPTPLYYWTMPFGTISRTWTETGAGAWRYDYREALDANEHFLNAMTARGEAGLTAMLRARSRQYRVMIDYLGAQRMAAEGNRLGALRRIAGRPGTWRLLLTRVLGRVRRAVAPDRSLQVVAEHPPLRLVGAQ